VSVPEIRNVDPPPLVIREAALPRPWLTYGLVATFALVYLGEATARIGGGTVFDPSIQTLIAWGGMSHALVVERGEWFRLLTAAFLHGGVAHLAMNSLAIVIAGATLEPMLGRLWFGALFFLGALAGGLASVSYNAPNIVGIGASGAIMALFGFFLTIAFRFQKGPVRRAFVVNSLGALVPSLLPALLPLFGAGAGLPIDYAAHGGGALAGAAVGLLLVLIWPQEQRFPPARALAALVIVAAIGVLGWGVNELRQGYAEHNFAASLLPDADQPRTDAEARRRAEEILRRYPNDPRGYFYKALVLADAGDFAGMESNARKAVERAERYPNVFRERFRLRVRMVHAVALNKLRRGEEARQVAVPVCMGDDELRAILSREGLCR
jgi:rhomboid protease GluP